jgi:threonine synthase
VETRLSLSAGWTPLVQLQSLDRSIWLKLDFLTPTGSFKDRGTELMMNVLAREGVARIADDSSGNAGASVAAYAACAGIQSEISVPSHVSPTKQAQIAVYGAHVHSVQGPRDNARLAAWDPVANGAFLASHAYHPGFLLGQQSIAWEVWEQMGREVPDWLIVPLGQGVHLLGAWLGFRRLRAAQVVDRIPRLVGVQSELLAPVAEALAASLDRVPPVEPRGTSIAEGLAIASPVRGKRVLQPYARATVGV